MATAQQKKVLQVYRDKLIDAKIRSQEARDKAILTLSGGALAISFSFIDHFVKSEPRFLFLLFSAWFCWAASLVLHIVSYHFGNKAFDWQIIQTDNEIDGKDTAQVSKNIPDYIVSLINLTVALLFVFGVISLGAFVYENYGVESKEIVSCAKDTTPSPNECGNITVRK